MATCQPNLSGISSRRSACDRCRLTKARCLRQDPDQPICDRCSRAGADCLTSPIFRLRSWQPPQARLEPHHERSGIGAKRQRRAHVQQQMPTPSDSGASRDLHDLGTTGSRRSGHGVGSYPAQQLQESSLVSDPAHRQRREVLEGRIDTPMGSLEYPFDMNFLDDVFENMNAVPTDTRFEVPAPLLHPPSTEATSQATLQTSRDGSPSVLNGSITGEGDEAPMDVDQSPMQQLSKLDYELITILHRIDRTAPGMRSRMFVRDNRDSPSPMILNDILAKTTKYIDVLKLMEQPCVPAVTAETKSRGSRRGGLSTSRRDYSSYSNDSSDYDSTASSTDAGICSPSPPRYTASGRELDMPSVLLAVGVYVRLLRLHLIAFLYLYEHLEELSASENPQLEPVASLGSCTSPHYSGNLQTLILLQIVTSLFEQLDIILGLPKEFRMSRHRRGHRGLLSESGHSDLIRSLLQRMDDGRPERERGGVKALRKHIAKAKRLLREHITP